MDGNRVVAMLRNLLWRDPPVRPAHGPQDRAPAPVATSAEELAEELREMRTSRGRFVCARHGTEAAVVKFIRGYSDASELVIDSYLGRSWHRVPVPADEATFGDPVAEALQDALARADVISLHLLNPKWTPFFCPSCARVYCGECWTIVEDQDPDEPGWPGTLRGICPEGHATVLTE
jgi:hypothetical protein